MGLLCLQSMGMNVFAGGKLEPVAARPLFWRACEKSASNLSSFNYVSIYFIGCFATLPFSSPFLLPVVFFFFSVCLLWKYFFYIILCLSPYFSSSVR